jgi:hypothetical protein
VPRPWLRLYALAGSSCMSDRGGAIGYPRSGGRGSAGGGAGGGGSLRPSSGEGAVPAHLLKGCHNILWCSMKMRSHEQERAAYPLLRWGWHS